jgi:hypothetical protein
VIDMDSSESPTFGEQEGSAYNGRFGCTCYHPLFVFNQFGDVERCTLRPGNAHSAAGWRVVPEPVVARYRGIVKRLYFRGDAAFANPEKYEYLQARGWGTRSGCRPTGFCRTRSDTCSSARSGDRRTRCDPTTPASAIRRRAGKSRGVSWRRSSAIEASFILASALSSPTWCGQPSASSPSTTSAARLSDGSGRQRRNQAKLRVSAPRRSQLIGSTLAARAVRDLPLPTTGEGASLGLTTTPNPANVG